MGCDGYLKIGRVIEGAEFIENDQYRFVVQAPSVIIWVHGYPFGNRFSYTTHSKMLDFLVTTIKEKEIFPIFLNDRNGFILIPNNHSSFETIMNELRSVGGIHPPEIKTSGIYLPISYSGNGYDDDFWHYEKMHPKIKVEISENMHVWT